MMSDDAAGLIVAAEVHRRLPGFDLELSTSDGLDIVDRILNRDSAVIIDSMVTGKHQPGTVVKLVLGRSLPTRRGSDAHTMGFGQAIELARACGAAVPARIVVYGIEVGDPHSVAECMSAALVERISAIADQIADDLQSEQEG